ncbi:MAG: polysaccharide deacetylase family protein [Ignavibacteriaceae bacterium]
MKKSIILITAALLTIKISAQVGSVSIKTWADDKKSAFSFTFDDGFISHYETAMPVLNSYGFKGTFYVISSDLTETQPTIWRYGTWDHFREIAAGGHEIGSHTVSHPDLSSIPAGDKFTPNTIHYELYQSKKTIKEKIPGAEVLTLAYPYIIHNEEVDNITDSYYEGGRSGEDKLNPSTLTKSQRLGIYSKKVQFNLPRNSPADDQDEWLNFKTYVNNAVTQNKWGAIMIHEVYPFSQIQWAIQEGSYYPMSSEWLTQLCEYLKNKSATNEVWVETVANVLKYSRERESFTSSIVYQSDSLIEIQTSDALDDEIYDFPLTADIVVPTDWDTVIVSQNGNTETVYAHIKNEQKIIRTYVIPDKGNITLQKYKKTPPLAAYSITGKITYAGSEDVPLQGIKIVLTGNPSTDSLSSDNDGNFLFADKTAGDYSLSFSNSNSWSGVNATDALAVLLYFTGSSELDDLQVLAADVNNDGNITASDALQILLRFSGSINSFPKPDWIFQPDLINISLSDSDQNFNINAVLTGDVNKSYHP